MPFSVIHYAKPYFEIFLGVRNRKEESLIASAFCIDVILHYQIVLIFIYLKRWLRGISGGEPYMLGTDFHIRKTNQNAATSAL